MSRLIAAATVLSLAACATVPEGAPTLAGWNCAAQGIKAAEYGGGHVASIQLESDKQGSVYTVTRVDEKTARGMTRNGTPFICRRAS